jgi:hypothetical protein
MRWALRIGAGLILAWLVFLASPFVALHGLGRAVETRDVEAVRARVNFRALRLSLLKQVIGAYLDERVGRALGPAERQLAADAGASLRGAVRLFRQSELRGFRNLVVSLPPDAPTEQQFRLRLRLVRTTWKLIGIELPDALLKRAVRDLGAGTRTEVKPPPQ